LLCKAIPITEVRFTFRKAARVVDGQFNGRAALNKHCPYLAGNPLEDVIGLGEEEKQNMKIGAGELIFPFSGAAFAGISDPLGTGGSACCKFLGERRER